MWHTHYPVRPSISSLEAAKKAAFTAPAAWNLTGGDIHERAAAPTATGAYLYGRAAPSGTGVYLYGRAAASGTGAYLYGRAAPTGTGAYHYNRAVAATGSGYLALRALPTSYNVVSWNETEQL